MYRYGMCDENGMVVNVIRWDSQSNFTIPKGYQLVRADNIDIGDKYDFATQKLTKKYELEQSIEQVKE